MFVECWRCVMFGVCCCSLLRGPWLSLDVCCLPLFWLRFFLLLCAVNVRRALYVARCVVSLRVVGCLLIGFLVVLTWSTLLLFVVCG